jgi:hypothetical protein
LTSSSFLPNAGYEDLGYAFYLRVTNGILNAIIETKKYYRVVAAWK